ncbi:cytochrome c oxidase cbb3-type subunit 3 [Kordia periserrulae]|uniref:Cytochrome c oxidase cbb3-type subunit 3 n=1 Tax=Kordia periserrulae TaxID=701523 RepID=A0A2T6BVM8_9FLAO|nr:cbb3-type cytochrome c oxidase N-terminal domain-containing protein [Kordia periserrulae]PTX60119.1 cytochrome c oxidase cbb3-type subunit 3 [Kordia periserrulae]
MKNTIPSWVRVLVVFFLIMIGIELFIESGDRPAFIENPMIMLFLLLVLLFLIAIEGIVAAVENVLFNSLDEKGKERYLENKAKKPKFTKLKKIYHKLVDSKPVEEEGEIILDHNYDGIKELDNNLPPWWLYGFYATIIFGVIYMLKYHVFDGDGQLVELEQQYAEAQVKIDRYNALNKDKEVIDFDAIELLTDASDISAGKQIFVKNCVSCHRIDGGGGIGANLTDEYWILGGGIKNVFKTISQGGRPGKGMESWTRKGLKASQIQQVASYVLTFQGTTPGPNAKPAEGEIWVVPEDHVKGEKLIDTIKVIDTIQLEKEEIK